MHVKYTFALSSAPSLRGTNDICLPTRLTKGGVHNMNRALDVDKVSDFNYRHTS